MSPEHFSFISGYAVDKKLLIFGAGLDSQFWSTVACELTIAEDDDEWVSISVHGIMIRVNYNTSIHADSLHPTGPSGFSPDAGEWDVVIVDGPKASSVNSRGREQSIFAASQIRILQGSIVFVHDYERAHERHHCDRFLGPPTLVIRASRDYRLLALWA